MVAAAGWLGSTTVTVPIDRRFDAPPGPTTVSAWGNRSQVSPSQMNTSPFAVLPHAHPACPPPRPEGSAASVLIAPCHLTTGCVGPGLPGSPGSPFGSSRYPSVGVASSETVRIGSPLLSLTPRSSSRGLMVANTSPSV